MQVNLKPLQESDARALFELVDTNRAYLKKFLGWLDQNTCIQHTLNFIKRATREEKKGTLVLRAIYIAKELVGLVSLFDIDRLNNSTVIGYWLDERHQGKGIMTTAVKQLISYAFEELKLHRIEIRCAIHNTKSQHIPERLGFTKEGTAKGAILIDQNYFDAYIYGLENKESQMFLLLTIPFATHALDAQKQAYAPYSNYHVGAAVVTPEGKVYKGCNVENASYGLTNCAERVAIGNAIVGGERKIDTIILASKDGAATPCGACRQVLYEFNPEMKVICINEQGEKTKQTALNTLLPDGFGPHNLQ